MTFTKQVKEQLFAHDATPIRLGPLPETKPAQKRRIRDRRRPGAKKSGEPWTKDEHERFLAGLEAYPSGPWKMVAACVQTRTTRQTMTHAQKYRQKIERRQRKLTGTSDSAQSDARDALSTDTSDRDTSSERYAARDASTSTMRPAPGYTAAPDSSNSETQPPVDPFYHGVSSLIEAALTAFPSDAEHIRRDGDPAELPLSDEARVPEVKQEIVREQEQQHEDRAVVSRHDLSQILTSE